MKVKRKKKVVGVILAISMLMSLLTVTPVYATALESDAPLGVFYNVNSWDGYTTDDFSITYSQEAKEGNYSLNINNINEVSNRHIVTKVPLRKTISSGDTYRISFWIKATNKEGRCRIENYSKIDLSTIGLTKTDEWVKCEKEITLTSNAKNFEFETWKKQRYIDDLQICKKNADGTYGENVALNGNFETLKIKKDNTPIPMQWSATAKGPNSATMNAQNTFIAQSDADARSGKNSLLVNVENELSDTTFRVLNAMNAGLVDGTKYRITAYIKDIEGSPRASFINSGGNIPGSWGKVYTGSGTLDRDGWYKVSYDFYGDEATDDRIGFGFWPKGSALMDDVTLYELDAANNTTGENLIVNGGFEAVEESNFETKERYVTKKPLEALPATVEATINIQKEQTGNAGTVLGNYWYTDADCFNFEIIEYGKPKIYIIDKARNAYKIIFDEVNVCTGEDVHVAITIDKDSLKAYCYIDGVLAQIKDTDVPDGIDFKYGLALGTDMRAGNSNYFKGYIRDVAIYSDVRTADEIAGDMTASTMDSNNLIAAWVMKEGASSISDISGNGYDMTLTDATKWIKEEPALDDYAYSFAVVGDTQSVNEVHPDKFAGMYDWIIDNKAKYNTKFVIGLGDITEYDSDEEWIRAKSAITKMNGIIPYSLVRGNHDSQDRYKRYLPFEEFGSTVAGSYNGDMLNTYQTFNVGKIKYLVLGLDYKPSANVIEWANDVIEAHPEHNVIITTHAYIFRNGELLNDDSFVPVTEGGENSLWNDLASKHKNVVLVLAGHIQSNRIVTTTAVGDNGNTVMQMLIDGQDVDKYYSESEGAGLISMFHFSEDGKTVQVRWYSTIKQAYFLEENQFTMELNVIESTDEPVDPDNPDPEVPVKPEFSIGSMAFNVNMSGSTDGKLIAALYDENGTLLQCKSYDVATNVPVSFDNCSATDTVKLFWWDETTLLPVTVAEKLNIVQ